MDPEWPATPGSDSIEGGEPAPPGTQGSWESLGSRSVSVLNFMRDNSNVQEFVSQQLLEEIGGWGRQGEFPLSPPPLPPLKTPSPLNPRQAVRAAWPDTKVKGMFPLKIPGNVCGEKSQDHTRTLPAKRNRRGECAIVPKSSVYDRDTNVNVTAFVLSADKVWGLLVRLCGCCFCQVTPCSSVQCVWPWASEMPVSRQ